ncbi:MAG: hypothetical protein AB7Q17_17210 [Phycisphaerae bacterium]
MRASTKTFLREIVDYAGLFPPAQLALEPAVVNYAAYQQSPDAWMLGRFICPAAKLGDLAPFRDARFTDERPLRLSVLGRGGETPADFLANLRDDLAAINRLHAAPDRRIRAEAFEVRLPAMLVKDDCTEALVKLLEESRTAFHDAALRDLPMACEPPLSAVHTDAGRVAAAGLSFYNLRLAMERRGSPADRVVMKLRCGGVEAAAFPSVQRVAAVLDAVRECGVAAKFTAGLHHPVRRFDAALGASMHGFVNVFGALLLATAHDLLREEIERILGEEDAAAFAFTDEGFGWRDLSITTDEIAAARGAVALSFGSCSFDEPRADLHALGWI